VELKEWIIIPNIVARLKVPAKTDRRMGPNKNAWCEFHQANDHYIRNCLALAHQLDELVKSGFLKNCLSKDFRKDWIEVLTTITEEVIKEDNQTM